MTEKEAIKELKEDKSLYGTEICQAGDGTPEGDLIMALDMGISALEKQIPKKPILKHDVSVMHINRGNQPHEWKKLEIDNWHCPICDCFVGERVHIRDKVHDQRKKKFCDNCGQAIDWSEEE